MSELISDAVAARLRDLKLIFLDMDGTIYMGDQIFPWTLEFLSGLEERGIRRLFLTNNSSRSAESYVQKLSAMGIAAEQSDIYTSGDATIDYLKAQGVRKLFLMGTPSLEDSFTKAGFELTESSAEMVVMGYDKTLTYEKLNCAYQLIRSGVPWCATHPDLLCPTPEGFDIDLGAMMQALVAATDVQPKVIGKPHAEMTGPLLQRLGIPTRQVAIMGDRLYTDIKTGLNGDLLSILVLSGEATRADITTSGVEPHLVLEKNSDLLSYLS